MELANPGSKTSFSGMGVDSNTESAGLHRAHDADRFAWAGSNTVFVIGTTAQPLNQ
jgi:hypothetical protein